MILDRNVIREIWRTLMNKDVLGISLLFGICAFINSFCMVSLLGITFVPSLGIWLVFCVFNMFICTIFSEAQIFLGKLYKLLWENKVGRWFEVLLNHWKIGECFSGSCDLKMAFCILILPQFLFFLLFYALCLSPICSPVFRRLFYVHLTTSHFAKAHKENYKKSKISYEEIRGDYKDLSKRIYFMERYLGEGN